MGKKVATDEAYEGWRLSSMENDGLKINFTLIKGPLLIRIGGDKDLFFNGKYPIIKILVDKIKETVNTL